MQELEKKELEKILEEIENTFKENIENIEDENGVHHFVIDSFTATFLAKEIIRKHMDNNNLCEKCSRRKWYQIGYKDGKNDGWIPVEERMPTKEEFLKDDGRFILDDGNRRYQGLFDIYDGKFKFSRHISGIHYELFEDKCVIAWHPLPDPYKKIQEENK